MSSTSSFISVADLCSKLLDNTPIVVVDVRDEDRAGGHIKGSVHAPSAEFERAVGAYVTQWKDAEMVVFHCMLSQMRGPACARTFQRAVDDAVKTGSLASAPQVLVLEGGFRAFARGYSKERQVLYEEFRPLF